MLRKNYLISSVLCLLMGITASAQPPDPLDYFPHQIGDLWQYRELPTLEIVETLVIAQDSTDSTGNIFIKYQQDPYYAVRIDTAYNVFYEELGPFGESPGLWYILSAQIGDRWIVNDDSPVYLRMWAQVMDIFQGIVFFTIPAIVMQIDYWWETPEIDSFWVETRYLAAGYGLVEREFEPGAIHFAAGAIINGVQYGIVTGLQEEDAFVPGEIGLGQNYPNPFNPTTTIEYQITTPSAVKLTIFNALGQNVTTLINEHQLPGFYKVDFTADGLNSGLYFYRLQANGITLTKKMILLH